MPVDESKPVGELDAGAVLRAARERAGLSVPAVAQSLKLTVRVVEALEANDRQRLPAMVYLRGFVRNYARLLGLDAEPLLSAFESERPATVERGAEAPGSGGAGFTSISNLSGRRGKRERRPLAAAGAALSLMAVVLLGVLVWPWIADERPGAGTPEAAQSPAESALGTGEGRDTAATDAASTAGGTAESTGAGSLARQGVDDLYAGQPEIPGAEGGQVVEYEGLPATGTGAVEGSPDPSSGGIALEPVALDAPDTGNGNTGVDVPGDDALEGDVPEDDSAELSGVAEPADLAEPSELAGAATDLLLVRRVTPTGNEELWFEFTEDCWVEVFDTDGEMLYQDLMSRRQSLRLVGAGPFQIRLGYAPGVTLAYNGEAVPLGPHTRNNVALLVLGQ